MTGKVSKNGESMFVVIIHENFSTSSDNLCQPQEVVRGCKPFVYRGFVNLTTYLKKIYMFCIYFRSVCKKIFSVILWKISLFHHSKPMASIILMEKVVFLKENA